MITHDRLFLQRVSSRIVDLDPRNPNFVLDIRGDYTRYIETKEQELAALQRQERVERNQLRRETERLRRGAQARQTKQNARIQNAEGLRESVDELKTKNRGGSVNIEFQAGR